MVKRRVEGCLYGRGVVPCPGRLEVLTQNIRLPLGRGSCLLSDDFTVIPANQIALTLTQVAAQEAPTLVDATPAFVKPAHLFETNTAAREELEDLLTHGIRATGTTNNSLVRICRYYYSIAGDRGEAFDFCKSWIDHKNNGKSRTYNISPARAYDKINEILTWLEKKRSKRVVNTTLGLSTDLCHQIFLAFPGNVNLQEKTFNLIRLIKDRAQYKSLIPLSVKLITSPSVGLSKNNYQKCLQKVAEMGLIERRVRGNNLLGISSLYRTFIPMEEFYAEEVHQNWIDFLKQSGNLCKLSKYLQRRIEDEYALQSS